MFFPYIGWRKTEKVVLYFIEAYASNKKTDMKKGNKIMRETKKLLAAIAAPQWC